MDTPSNLAELFAETAIADPKLMSRKDLEELIRSVLADPDVLDPISVSASAKATSAFHQSDAKKSLRDMLKAEIRNIMIDEESPLPSTIYGSPRPPFQPFPLLVEKVVPKVNYLKTTIFSVDIVIKANVIEANWADTAKKWTVLN
jgi:hypothetical protein